MTRYFLTVPHDSVEEPTMATMDPAELEATLAAVSEFNAALEASRALLFAGGLHPPSTAKTVDVSTGEPRVLDEPFVQAPAYVGGFWLIEVEDEAAAVEWTIKAATALQGRIEVRALQEVPSA